MYNPDRSRLGSYTQDDEISSPQNPRWSGLMDRKGLHSTAISNHHMASGRNAEDAHDLVPIQCLGGLDSGLTILAWKRERATKICIQVATMGVEQ